MKCRYCGNELKNGERFCRRCGKPVETEPVQSSRFCSECGAELLPNAGFCRSCGAPVSQQKPEQPQQLYAAQTDEKAELKRRTEILVIAAQGGDSESFAKLYELYHQKVFALAKTTVKSDADAEDVLQMTFIKAWDHLDRLKDTSAFSTWIQRITLNQCYSLLRKQHATIPIDNDDEDSEPIQIESDLMLPEVYAEQNDLKKRLGKIIDELSDVQKQTITLYYFDGLPVENIAWIMDCSVNTVKSRLFLARKSIKTEIEEQERKSGQPFYGIVGLATTPFGQFFVAHVKASSLSQTAASALLKAIAGKISQSASAAAKAGTSAAVKAGTSAAAKGAANAGAKTAAAAGTKAAAGAGAKTAAAVGASVSKKVIAGIVAGTLAVGTVAGGTVATVKIVQNNRERKAAESATTVVTDGTFPSVTASDPFLPQDPSDGLSAQEREAYQAYLDYLIAHKEGIDNYLWQIGGWEYYYEIEEGTDRFVPLDEPMTEDARLETRSVVFYDISGDALPELIYVGDVASPAKYTSVCTLNVLTYRDDQLVSLFSGEWYQPKWEDFTEAESLYVRPDGTLVSYYSEGATFDSLDYYEVFAAGENGTLHREFALKHVYDSFEYDEGDGSPIVEEWYGPNKERITKEEYEAQLKGVMPKDCILLFDRYSYASFAMTADEAIAWLQSQLGMTAEAPATPAPTAEPTLSDVGATSKPEDISSDTARNAYQAYIEVLEKNRKFIQLYEEYPGVFDNTLDKTPDHTQRAVAFHDLNNDGIPELIYIRDQGSDENDIELNVLSFQHEEIITVYTNNVLAGDAGNYFYFTLKDDPTIYVNFKDDAEYTDLTGTYSDLYSNEYYIMDNSWKDAEEKPFLSDSEEYVASKGGFAHVYRENDKEIDRAAFEAKERALLDRMDCCLILGWMASQTMECNAMTCDEAIAWLKSQLGTESETPSAEADPGNSQLIDALTVYAGYLNSHRTQINNYVWQFDEWTVWQDNEWNRIFLSDCIGENNAFARPKGTAYVNTFIPRSVVLCDFIGDEIPELICIFAEDDDLVLDQTKSRLEILTYRDDRLCVLYSDVWDTMNNYMESTGYADTFEFFTRSGDNNLYLHRSFGMTNWHEEWFEVFSEAPDGSLARTVLFHEYASEDEEGYTETDGIHSDKPWIVLDPPEFIYHYYYRGIGDGIPKETFQALRDDLLSSVDRRLMNGGFIDGSKTTQYPSMSCDELLDQIGRRISG